MKKKELKNQINQLADFVLELSQRVTILENAKQSECDQDHSVWQTIFSYFIFCPVCGEKL